MLTPDLRGKNVVITGASSGLGRATAIAFSKLGANLCLLARREELLQETGTLIEGDGALLLTTDISDAAQVHRAADAIADAIGHVDILVNNAAGWFWGSLETITPEQLSVLVSTTITGTILMTKYLLPHLQKSRDPHIVNVASTAGIPSRDFDHTTSSTAYHAAKCGQAGFSEGLRSELKERGIRVSTLYPGAFASQSTLDDSPDDIVARYGQGVMGVSDVVDSILFIVSRSPLASVQSLVIA